MNFKFIKQNKMDNWKPVGDGKPNAFFSVIACDEDGFVCEAWINEDGYWEQNGRDAAVYLNNVTHWMKMPEAPAKTD